MTTRLAILAVFLAVFQIPGALAGDSQKSLYERMGGRRAIEKLMSEFVDMLVRDTRINVNKHISAAWKRADIPKIKKGMSDYLCETSGGGCLYAGKDMETIHKSHNVSVTEWKYMLENLNVAMKKAGIAPKEAQEVRALIDGTEPEIVREKY